MLYLRCEKILLKQGSLIINYELQCASAAAQEYPLQDGDFVLSYYVRSQPLLPKPCPSPWQDVQLQGKKFLPVSWHYCHSSRQVRTGTALEYIEIVPPLSKRYTKSVLASDFGTGTAISKIKVKSNIISWKAVQSPRCVQYYPCLNPDNGFAFAVLNGKTFLSLKYMLILLFFIKLAVFNFV